MNSLNKIVLGFSSCTLCGSLAIAQSQVRGAQTSGLGNQPTSTSPYSAVSPYVTPVAPNYDYSYGINVVNPQAYSSPAGNPSGPQAPAPSMTNTMPDPSSADISSGTTMSSQGGTFMSTQGVPATGSGPSTQAPASAVPSAPASGGTQSGSTSGSSSTGGGM